MKKFTYLAFLVALIPTIVYAQSQTATLTLHIQNFTKENLKATLLTNSITKNTSEVIIPFKESTSSKVLDLKNSSFIIIDDGKNLITSLLEPNDDITISYDYKNFDKTLTFNGKGSDRFTLSYTYQTLMPLMAEKKIKTLTHKDNSLPEYLTYMDSVETALLSKLNTIMNNVSSTGFNQLKGEVKGAALQQRYEGILSLSNQTITQLTSTQSTLTQDIKDKLSKLMTFYDSFYRSPSYLNATYFILSKEYDVNMNKKGVTYEDKYKYLNNKLENNLKIPVLTMFFEHDLMRAASVEEFEPIIHETFINNSTSEYKSYAAELYSKSKVGKKAPDFVLEDIEGKKISLQGLLGKVVYIDFWFSGCTPCHNLFEKIQPAKEHFKGNPNVVFLSVSIDNKEIWIGSLKKYNIMGYHAYTMEQGAEHPIVKSYSVKKFPTTYLIDKSGKFYSTTPPQSPDALINLIDNALNESDRKVVTVK